MNERAFRVFYEVAVMLNMTEVANKMYISQPAVSQTISELEKHLNVKLFDRMGKRLYLTHEGEIFLTYVRRILNIYDEGIKLVKDMNEFKMGKMKIGASTTIGIYVLPDIIGKFIRKYKNIDVSIAIENTKIIANMILENKIDFGFVEGPVYQDEIICKNFCQDELVLIVPSDHNWASLQEIDINDIPKEKMVMREKGSGTREVFENLMNSNNINYKIAFELGNTEAIKKAVEAGLGMSCISKRCVENEVRQNKISVVKLKNIDIKRNFSLIYHKDKYISKLFNEFIEFAKINANKC
ncbi:HTH-type transcriptional regulator CysL [Clostridium acetireducens DSM 10703]|jgi:DNA-binding transcriptional LysR family regulator|uniref:HTH-type transcriptional regulator CysL n=1 Tax=Clostridium acetireducens DSM 10703 TaxID=1121290 RepID=A0A1E8EZM6_9CLOT|nr:selenium metabolism-associated LysR family transcriptional regulator [Clostridium acetireducens]OFI06613.1 HTH-type transcriptional regulator CysL [Clostridium acetireducens DSM 10703]